METSAAKRTAALAEESVCGFDGEPLTTDGHCVKCGALHLPIEYNAVAIRGIVQPPVGIHVTLSPMF